MDSKIQKLKNKLIFNTKHSIPTNAGPRLVSRMCIILKQEYLWIGWVVWWYDDWLVGLWGEE